MLLCAGFWLLTSDSFTGAEWIHYNLVSGCYHYRGTAWQNLQFIHTCLVLFFSVPRHLFIFSLVDHFNHHSLNQPSFRLADSLPTVTDVWLHTRRVSSILFTHWQTFDLSKHIPTLRGFSVQCARLVKLLHRQQFLINYLDTSVKITSASNNSWSNCYKRNYFGLISTTRAGTWTCINRQPHLFRGHCLCIDKRHRLYKTGN